MLAYVHKFCGRDMGIYDSFFFVFRWVVLEGLFAQLLIEVPVVLIRHVLAQKNVFAFKCINFVDLK